MSVDTSRIDRSTKASIRSAYQFTSPPMKIGKTFWRFVIVPSRYGAGLVTDYEWLNADDGAAGIWYPSDQRRGYDHNDGVHAGLPKSLRKLWELHRHEFEKLNGSGEPEQLTMPLDDENPPPEQPTPGLWRVFDAFTDVEIVTDHPTANETESIVQFRGQRNAPANARLIVRAVNSHEHFIRACRLLVEAYAKGAESEHIDWEELDLAHETAVFALGIAEDRQP
jgi:hypothetical protein